MGQVKGGAEKRQTANINKILTALHVIQKTLSPSYLNRPSNALRATIFEKVVFPTKLPFQKKFLA